MANQSILDVPNITLGEDRQSILPTFSSLDTETIFGYARLVILGDGNHYYIDRFEDIGVIIEKYSGTSFFCYNMEFDFRALIKSLPFGVRGRIYHDGKKGGLHKGVNVGDFSISYMAKKEVVIRYRKGFINYHIKLYDLAQFYDFKKLDDAGKDYLGVGKKESILIETFKKCQVDSEGEWLTECKDWFEETLKNSEILEYAIQDAKLTKALADLFINEVNKLGISPQRYLSVASMARASTRKWLADNNREYPAWNPHGELEKLIRQCFHGAIFECQQRGDFGPCIEYDFRSAYPSTQVTLPYWQDGNWKTVAGEQALNDTIKGQIEGDYYFWGICKINSPYIPHKTKDKKLVYPTGEREAGLTNFDYDLLRKINHPCEFLYGVVWTRSNLETRGQSPFGWEKLYYEQRKAYPKKTMPNQVRKLAPNSAYGITCDSYGGQFTNYAYASLITSKTRCDGIRAVIEAGYENKMIYTATDGLLLEGDISLPNVGDDLGQFEKTVFDRALVIGNGIYELERGGEKPEIKKRFRGYSKVSASLRQLIEDRPWMRWLQLETEKVVTLGDIITHPKKYAPEDLNKFIREKKVCGIYIDSKRKWPEISMFGDLIGRKHRGIRIDINETDKISRMLRHANKDKPRNPSKPLMARDLPPEHLRLLGIEEEILDSHDLTGSADTGKVTLNSLLVSYVQFNHISSISIPNEKIKLLQEGDVKRKSKEIYGDDCLVSMAEIRRTQLSVLHELQEKDETIVLLTKVNKERKGEDEYVKCLRYAGMLPDGKTNIELVGGRITICIDGKQVLEPQFEGGKLTGVYKQKLAKNSAVKTAEKLYSMNQAPFFPHANGSLCIYALTFPHTEAALKMTAKKAKQLSKEFLAALGKKRGWLSPPAFPLNNFHLWSSKTPYLKHPHVIIGYINNHHDANLDMYVVSSPVVKQEITIDEATGELEPDFIEEKRIWESVLRKNHIIKTEDKTRNGDMITAEKLDIHYSFIHLYDRAKLIHRLEYEGRSPLVDLDKYYQEHKFEPENVDKEVLKEIVNYKNYRSVGNGWENLNKLLQPISESVCPVCNAVVTGMDIGKNEVKRIIEETKIIVVDNNLQTRMYDVFKINSKYVKIKKRLKNPVPKAPKKPAIADDLFDYRAWHDSTLSKFENEEIIKNQWKNYVGLEIR